jgi:hypothetical protein
VIVGAPVIFGGWSYVSPFYWEPTPPPPAYWYYCPSANAYYPYVLQCLEGWRLVVPYGPSLP